MYGFSSYEEYKNGRIPVISKIGDFVKDLIYSLYIDDRRLVSDEACDDGYDYFNDDNYPAAIEKFNRGWLLDHENPCILSAYGYVVGKNKEYDRAAKFYDEAIARITTDKSNYWYYTDYAEIMILCYQYNRERIDCWDKALKNYQIAESMADKPKVHRILSYIKFLEGDYDAAWREIHAALDGGHLRRSAFKESFFTELSAKLADPYKK